MPENGGASVDFFCSAATMWQSAHQRLATTSPRPGSAANAELASKAIGMAAIKGIILMRELSCVLPLTAGGLQPKRLPSLTFERLTASPIGSNTKEARRSIVDLSQTLRLPDNLFDADQLQI